MRLLDAGYFAAAGLTAPIWLWRWWRAGKLRTDWRARFGAIAPLPDPRNGRVLLHAVSVGEVNAARLLVDALAEGPSGAASGAEAGGAVQPPEVVIATTTDTGFRRARELYGARHAVLRYPFDASFAVERFLDATRPDLVILVELEVWPNFVRSCAERSIPVVVVNGRLSARSARRYAAIGSFVRPTFRRLAAVAAQDETYAERFRRLGAAPERVVVTGTMKWDTAQIADHVPGAAELAEEMGIDRTRPLVVAGSSAREEHSLLHRSMPEGAQLLCAPRKPEWFEVAAASLPGCARRSRGDRGSAAGRFLLDTIGELRKAYALADLVVVGRTFVDLGGSDMIEPIALGKATIVGPHLENFADAAAALRDGDGLFQCDAAGLAPLVGALLADPAQRSAAAERGRAVIRSRQGATRRTVELIRSLRG
ncbi:MAG TPA: glycosyltransferase N-terminal domain-containing protein [Phycisphaerales bacterium]|nr:glycosyltransferase N-terminal domain-containing protein [Phycisphaerales bacterium]HMP36499.1 glycosyltransferase N-terminal domain-containing protein [Phycisphaerales bacterium]